MILNFLKLSFVSPDFAQILGKQDWIEVLTEVPDETETRWLRLNTHTGRPLGSDGFVSKLERFLERRLRPLPVGRPRKIGKRPLFLPYFHLFSRRRPCSASWI